MKKSKTILFWIFFPLLTIIFTGLTIFYLDMMNGPVALLVIEIIFIILFIIYRIILRNNPIYFRLVPLLTLLVVTTVVIVNAKPGYARVKGLDHYSLNQPELDLANGRIKGLLTVEEDVEVYVGVPYAKAPIGELRWKEPVPIDNWEGVKDCTYFAPRSMQADSSQLVSSLADLYASKGWYPNFVQEPLQDVSEDSLYLNIYRPHNEENNLPILVFIHGGSLTTGSSAYRDYRGEEMARTGVIMISITYRLGVFGYFASQELIDESVNHTTGNYGLLDQIEALKWINNNASYFGGDKNNITIAGESAGSSSVSAICSSPLAKGLFKNAIGESSSIVDKRAPHTYRKMSEALEVGQEVYKEFNCKNIEELRKIPAERLVNTKTTNSSMTLDGYALTKDPYQVYVDGENNETNLLNGFNVLEADAFVIPTYLFSPTNKNNIKDRLIEEFGELTAEQIYNLYIDKINEDAFSAFNEIYSVHWFMEPHYCWSNMASNNGVNVYRYQFTKENKFHGTYHAGEMIYAYGNIINESRSYRYDDSDRELSRTMLTYWSNFAKTGNPNGDGLVNWDKYITGSTQLMELGSRVGMKDDPYLDLYDIISSYRDIKNSEE